MTLFSKVLIAFVRLYQKSKILSDMLLFSTFGVVSQCPHTPSCSEFMIIRIQKRGTIVGLVQGVTRILSCHTL